MWTTLVSILFAATVVLGAASCTKSDKQTKATPPAGQAAEVNKAPAAEKAAQAPAADKAAEAEAAKAADGKDAATEDKAAAEGKDGKDHKAVREAHKAEREAKVAARKAAPGQPAPNGDSPET